MKRDIVLRIFSTCLLFLTLLMFSACPTGPSADETEETPDPVWIDTDGDGVGDGIDTDGDGEIDIEIQKTTDGAVGDRFGY